MSGKRKPTAKLDPQELKRRRLEGLAKARQIRAAKAKTKKLTPKQEKFCHEYLKTGNASEAYRRAYDVSSNIKPNTVEKLACGLVKDENVARRINELKNQAAAQAVLDKAWVLERLMRNARICLGEEMVKVRRVDRSTGKVVEAEIIDRDAAAANKALELLGKELGMFVERKEIGAPGEFADLSDAELAAIAAGGGARIAAQKSGAAAAHPLH